LKKLKKIKKFKKSDRTINFQVGLMLVIGIIFAGLGVLLLANSHASTVYTVPDQRNNTNPNLVIDPTGVKDSTAGLQSFFNSVPNGSSGNNNTILLPAGAKYRVNGGVTSAHSYVTFTTNLSNPAQLFADSGSIPEAYPWRVRPIAPNTDGRQSPWFMDEFPTNNPLSNHATLGESDYRRCAQLRHSVL
jgi:hypothetical protein